MEHNRLNVIRSLDDSSVIDHIEDYRQAVVSGQNPDRQSILSQFPELADELNACLNAVDVIGRIAVQLQAETPSQVANTAGTHSFRGRLESLGDYSLVREIGHGGMGVVYEAVQLSLSRRVAVKILPFASLWPETSLERFRNEVRIAAMLEHRHIVPIYEFGCERSVHFYAMKLIDGCSLADVIRRRKQSQEKQDHPSANLPPAAVTTESIEQPSATTIQRTTPHSLGSAAVSDLPSADDGLIADITAALGNDSWYHAAARLGQAAADALSFAHERGVIHRDIKPSNLLLDRAGKLFVADFGLARCETDVNLTRTGELIGTPRYMSPEQALGSSSQVDPRTDIYSLGATLYELLTLQPVISAPGRAAVLRQLRELSVVPLREHDASIPRPLELIVLKCLESDPRDRYRSAADLSVDLGRFLAGQPIATRPMGLVRRTRRWASRHPRTTLGLSASLSVCLVLTVLFTWITQHPGYFPLASRGPPEGGIGSTISASLALEKNPSLESPDMLRSPRNNRNGKNNETTRRIGSQETARKRFKKHLRIEQLEDRRLLAMVASWSAENNALDLVGGNDGALLNGATYAPGQVGTAFSFDGVNDRISIADSQSLKLTQSLTIEGWIKTSTIPTQERGTIFFRGDDRFGLDPYQLMLQPGGSLIFQVQSLTGTARTSAPMPLGQFVHVAATLNHPSDPLAPGSMRIYVNSVLMSEISTLVRPLADLDPTRYPGISIGNYLPSPATAQNSPFSGLIDELTIYDHALSQADVAIRFNAGNGGLQPTLSISDSLTTEGKASIRPLDRFVKDSSGGVMRPQQLTFGPDGNLYLADVTTNSILKYDGATGNALGTFVTSGLGGLNSPGDLIFDTSGNLLVTGRLSNKLHKYDSNGAFLGTVGSGFNAPLGIERTSDGSFLIANNGTNQILKVSGSTVTTFISAGSGGLVDPEHAIIGPDGDIFVVSSDAGSILRYDGTTRAPKGIFAVNPSGAPMNWAEFGTDGHLYASYRTTSLCCNVTLARFNGTTGALEDSLDTGRDSWSFTMGPNTVIYNAGNGAGNFVDRFVIAEAAAFTVSLNAPFPDPVSVTYGTADGTASGTPSVNSDYVTSGGTVTFAPGEFQKTILVSTYDDAVTEGNETFVVNLSNPSNGVTFADNDNRGEATIVDNEYASTKFYVVNDSSPDQTYRYGPTGAAFKSSVLDSGNTAPRGAASNAAGDKVWVVDKNKKVYVYSNSGGLLGSGWSAGSLQSSSIAELQGITTNGSDVWLVENTFSSNKNDMIYRYNGAASLISGNQNKSSSFSLNSANRNSTDLVTDGTNIWVLNNTSTTDKVFKYTVGGTLLGSWTITGGGGSPTGITIDPNNVSNIWIVDNNTDRVYQFDAASNQTSGSASPSSSFPLAPGNTNPQGIADPPVPSSAQSQNKPNGQGSSERLLALNSSPIASSGLPAIQPNRSSSEFDRSKLTIQTVEEVQTTSIRTTNHLPDSNALVAQPALREAAAVSQSESNADLAFADKAFEWLDDSLLSLLAQGH